MLKMKSRAIQLGVGSPIRLCGEFPVCDECGSENIYRKTDASWCKKNQDWTEVQGVEFHCFECGNESIDVGEEFY
tara:strand:+ start:237 stop:461 length:225 start_codon:yes stop_codon:yes gene_type:complete